MTPAQRLKNIIGGSAGNFVEWFDWFAYASFALYFSRATIPWHRDGFAQSKDTLPEGYAPLRHIGLYAYSNAFLQAYPGLQAAPIEEAEAHVEALPPLVVVDTGPPEQAGHVDAAGDGIVHVP